MTCPVCDDTGLVAIRVYRNAHDLTGQGWDRRPCSAPGCPAGQRERANDYGGCVDDHATYVPMEMP